MKRTTIIAILVVFALAATPLWTVNATADDVMEPISVDVMEPISVDVMEPISVDCGGNGHGILAQRNNEIHGEMAEYVLLIIGEDGNVILTFEKAWPCRYEGPRLDSMEPISVDCGGNGHGNGRGILAQSNNEIHGEMAEYVLLIIGEDGGITILDESKGFSSLIRSEPPGDFHLDGIIVGGEWYQNADGSNPFDDVAGGGGVSIGVSGGGDLSDFLSLLGVPIYTVTVE
jgi:hypothetical protein